MGKTKLQTSWKKDHPWLVPVKDDVYSAKCVPCDKVLAVHSGVGSIKQHEITPSHVSKTKVMAPSQAKFFTIGDSFMLSSKKGKMNLTSEQQKRNAEILRALNVVEKNHRFLHAMRTTVYINACSLTRELQRIIHRVKRK